MRTDAQIKDKVRSSTARRTSATGPVGDKPKPLKAALQKLCEAAREKDVESICAAYQHLRMAARKMQVGKMLQLAEQALASHGAGIAMVVSAFSHRHCFMCNGGILPCQACEASGLVEEHRHCIQCDGLGLISCDFCRGTGWADRQAIPRELLRAVVDRQLLHTRDELVRVSQQLARLKGPAMRQLSEKQRRGLAAWLMRVQARLTDLANNEEIRDDAKLARLAALAANIDKTLELLKVAQ